jgi:integrase
MTFRTASEHFVRESEAITQDERNKDYCDSLAMRLRVTSLYGMCLGSPTVMDGCPICPIYPHPNKTAGKVEYRAWFSPVEYKLLYEATRERAKNPPKECWREVCETFHDYVLFMGNTGLRPDESARLEMRDVKGEATGDRILEIEVKGKRGIGYCKSMPRAILPYERVRKRKDLMPIDRVFRNTPRKLMTTVLDKLNLKLDRVDPIRTCYSLRHTYLSLRLLEDADIYQIAKNCRTSVEMLDKFYGRHLKNNIDAAAVNVCKTKAALLRKKVVKVTL